MNTDSLTSLLHDATEDLEPRAGFAGAVVTGGRRRLARRRLAVAASAAVAVLLIGGAAYAVVGHIGTEQVMSADEQLLSQPTKGDLAGDAAFVRQAGNEWLTGLPNAPDADRGVYDDLRGEPHVYWAGNTPAGRAAVVVQQIYVRQNSQLHLNAGNGLRMAAGLVAVDPADDKLKLLTVQWQMDTPADRVGYFRFGPGDRTVLIVPMGKPIFYSPEAVLRDHKPVRDWRRMPEHDGVAIVQLPGGVDPDAAIVVERDTQPPATYTDRAYSFALTASSADLAASSGDMFIPPTPTGIRWMYGPLSAGSTGGLRFDPHETYTAEVANKLGHGGGGYSGGYYIWQVLPDGRVAVVSDIQNDEHPARFYALLATPDMQFEVYDGGVVNAAEPLPVHFRMPDKQGWIVAQLNQPLKYRTSTTGQWHDAGMDAALVPDNTVQVMVGTQVVDLPR